MTELANIQRWLTSIIIKPGALSERIKLADQAFKLNNGEVIRSSQQMSSGQKIGIYARGYVLRLMECMLAEYPAVHQLLGEELFNTFAKGYLIHVPSRSPDLYDLGKNFAAFLKSSQPQNDGGSTMLDLPVELARLERALAEVSRSKGLEGQGSDSTMEHEMLYLFGTTAFRTSPCLVLLQFQFPVVGFVKAVHRGQEAQTPDESENFVAISRKNYVVNMHETEAWQWYFLQSLQSTGNYMVAVNLTAEQCSIAPDTLLADLMLWIPLALSFGYIYLDTAE